MAPDSCLSTLEANPPKTEAPPRSKFRVRFAKTGDLRLVSHHDLMHVCERLFRRAELEVHVTQGFNPRPRIWFASAIALGVAGLNEVLEFELVQSLDADEVMRRLCAKAPPGIVFHSVRSIDAKTSGRVRRAFYRLALLQGAAHEVSGRDAVAAFLQKTEHWVERRRPQPRRINVRPFVDEMHAFTDRIEMALWITDNGAARPDEILTALGLKPMLDDGAVIERTDLELYDELPPDTPGPPMLRSAIQETTTNEKEVPQERPTAIFDNPMSFDS